MTISKKKLDGEFFFMNLEKYNKFSFNPSYLKKINSINKNIITRRRSYNNIINCKIYIKTHNKVSWCLKCLVLINTIS